MANVSVQDNIPIFFFKVKEHLSTKDNLEEMKQLENLSVLKIN